MDPAIAMWINIAIGAFGGIATVAPGIATASAAGQTVVQVAGGLAAMLGALNGVLHATSPATAGPLNK